MQQHKIATERQKLLEKANKVKKTVNLHSLPDELLSKIADLLEEHDHSFSDAQKTIVDESTNNENRIPPPPPLPPALAAVAAAAVTTATANPRQHSTNLTSPSTLQPTPVNSPNPLYKDHMGFELSDDDDISPDLYDDDLERRDQLGSFFFYCFNFIFVGNAIYELI